MNNNNENKEPRQVGAVIHFLPGVTRVAALQAIRALEEQNLIEWKTVQEYNPDYGSPVFYVP